MGWAARARGTDEERYAQGRAKRDAAIKAIEARKVSRREAEKLALEAMTPSQRRAYLNNRVVFCALMAMFGNNLGWRD